MSALRQALTVILEKLERPASTPRPATAGRRNLLLGVGLMLMLCLFIASAVVGAIVIPALLTTATPTASVTATATATATTTATRTPSPTVTQTATPTETARPTTTPTSTNPPSGFTLVWPNDNAVVVYVPAGLFIRGSVPGGVARSDELPQASVFLNGFWIDQTEVTVAHYRACVLAGACSAPFSPTSATAADYYGNPQFDNHPVIQVIWQDAVNYCRWAGRRLPTEAEWEKAARGTDGRIYPWGDQAPTASRANYGHVLGETSDVQTFRNDISPYGVLNMAGNVREWISDWYDPTYYATGPSDNPRGPSEAPDKTRQFRVFRGGSWNTPKQDTRTTARFSTNAGQWLQDLGFRCAATP